MKPDFGISGNKVLTENGLEKAIVLIKDGKIIDIVDSVDNNDFPIENIGDSVLMPGIVDTHVHVNEPGRTDWEGFETATKACGAGGITTLVDMPLNCIPVTTSKEALNTKLEAIKNKMFVDCGFWGGLIPENSNNIKDLLSTGVMGVKAFLIDSGIEEFPNVTEEDLRKAMPVIKEFGVPLIVHAEVETDNARKEFDNSKSYKQFLESRPKEWENEAVKMMICLCKEFGCRTHIVHLSSADVLNEIKEAKKQDLPFTVETCPHYLTLNYEDIPDGDSRYKCCPPIREKNNNDLLWEGLKDGTIDFIVSDHSPCTANLKLMEDGDVEHAWGGISGLQFSLSIVWTEARKRGFSISEISKLMSQKTAEFVGLKKGKIAKDYDADLIIWNPDKTFKVETSLIQHKNKLTPYLNKEFYGLIEKTFVRGQKVYDNGNFSNLNLGEFLLRK